MWYGIGKTGFPNPAGVFLEILEDGNAILYTGCADIGQGSTAALGQIAAEELGLEAAEVLVVSADTHRTPDSGITSASRTTYIIGKAVQIAGEKAKEPIVEEAAEQLSRPVSDLAVARHSVYSKSDSSLRLPWGEIVASCHQKGIMCSAYGFFNPITQTLDKNGQGAPYATYSFGTQAAVVEVDPVTLKVKVLLIIAAHDVGRAINPLNVEGQIEGGCVMGLGQALLEEITECEGKILTPSYSEYLIPTSLDVPDIEPVIVENKEETGPFGAKGIAEPSSIPTAPAIANAIYNAIGVRIMELPITPEKIKAALEKTNK
jgi:CO/xanthine dehydrogenase Mo-binding subunit